MRVAVLGGGMGGLSCAHELTRAGVDVTIYESGQALGGKARSHSIPGTGTEGRRDLPGEHGFRFYPAFYRHVIATMEEIPDSESPTGTVAGNLVGTSEAGVATPRTGVVAAARRARSAADARRTLESLRASGGNLADLTRYLGAHVKFLTACDGRRDTEIEATSWARFIGADAPGKYEEEFRKVLLACTRTMVAMDAERGSSRTIGQASSLLLLDAFGRGDVDRTMMGPTTDCWIEPWQRDLERRGVAIRFGHAVERIDFEHGRVARAWARDHEGEPVRIDADAFVLAVPLEVALRLITPEMLAADAELGRLANPDIEALTSWMVGAQFYLREDVPLCAGHLFFPSSPWSLTTISQAQFWNLGRRGMDRFGDGRLRGIISVDVSSCFAPDEQGVRLVDETSREGVLKRILSQILDAVDAPTRHAIERAVYMSKLDDEVTVGPQGVTNAARLLVHPPGSRRIRPSPQLDIPNLCLAADFARTSVDLASMEGANEAGRTAARAILETAGLDASSVRVFDYPELATFERLRALDAFFHARGLPHLFDLPPKISHVARGALRASASTLGLLRILGS